MPSAGSARYINIATSQDKLDLSSHSVVFMLDATTKVRYHIKSPVDLDAENTNSNEVVTSMGGRWKHLFALRLHQTLLLRGAIKP